MNNLVDTEHGLRSPADRDGHYCLLTMKNTVKLLIGIEVIAKGVTLALSPAASPATA